MVVSEAPTVNCAESQSLHTSIQWLCERVQAIEASQQQALSRLNSLCDALQPGNVAGIARKTMATFPREASDLASPLKKLPSKQILSDVCSDDGSDCSSVVAWGRTGSGVAGLGSMRSTSPRRTTWIDFEPNSGRVRGSVAGLAPGVRRGKKRGSKVMVMNPASPQMSAADSSADTMISPAEPESPASPSSAKSFATDLEVLPMPAETPSNCCQGVVLLPDSMWRQVWNAVWLLLCLSETAIILLNLCWFDSVSLDMRCFQVLVVLYVLNTAFFAGDMVLQVRVARAGVEAQRHHGNG